MRPLLRRPTLLVVVALVTLPTACAADHGSLGNHVTDTGTGAYGSGADDGDDDGGGTSEDVGTGSTGGGGTATTISESTVTTTPGCGPIQLADVAAGNGGFAVDGEEVGDFAGRSVSGAGDVNGDGASDVLVGAGWASPNDINDAGRTYVVFGRASTDRVQLADVAQGIGGFALDGEGELDATGQSVSGAGDVNGDGLADVVVGAGGEHQHIIEGSGRAYVVFGKADTDRVSLADLAQGPGGFVLDPEPGWPAGWVSGVGDVNGDGLADVVVGAAVADANGIISSGRTYVVFGKTDTEPVFLADVAEGTGGFAVDGEAEHDGSGSVVNGAGDVNGDGLADVIVGVMYADPNGLDASGRTYVVFGKADTDKVLLGDVTQGVGGFAMDGEAEGDYSGESVAGAGDVNGDGVSDVLVGADWASANGIDRAGRTYVVFGKADTDKVSLAEVAAGAGGLVLDGEGGWLKSGSLVSGAGDLNGDGFADVMVGESQANPNGTTSGRTYVAFGKADGAPVSLAGVVQGIGGFALDGAAEDDRAGYAVSEVGDMNGDGVPEVVVGAAWVPASGLAWSGRTYVIFGGDFSCEGR